jgi:seryl-tRNA synthetase
MLDIKFIRENKDLIEAGAKKKHLEFKVDELITVDDKRKELLVLTENKKAEQNKFSDEIIKVQDPVEKKQLIDEMKTVKDDLMKGEEELKEVMKTWQGLMLQVPNIPDMTVPEGDDDASNKEYSVWGEIPKFDFPVKDHVELMEKLDMVDLEAGTRISGFRGYILKNDGALLNYALWQFVMEYFRENKKDYSPMLVPSLVRRETLLGTGYLPQGEDDMYKTQDGDYLAGTAEVAAMSYFSGKTFTEAELPKKVIALSPAFRREAGSHSKDVKGVFRVHEFMKFEQVILCEANHEASVKYHEELRENAEELLRALKLPYHVVINCGGDLGLGQVKKYDIEAWSPSQNKYRETHSCSYFHDFQTRRLNIKYKDAEGKSKFVHSLNNTALATPRILLQIVENNQQADGSIKIPEVLQKYMGKSVISK